MSHAPVPQLLDRDFPPEYIATHHGETIRFLEDLVNYGTRLITDAFAASPQDVQAGYLILTHLHQLVAHLDGATVLLKQGCCFSAHSQVRSLLESFLVLSWLLKEDTENRTEHIFVANVRREIETQSIGIPGTKQAIKHADAASKLTLTPEALEKLKEHIKNLQEVLADPPARAAINQKFEDRRKAREDKGKEAWDPQWYEFCGASSIRQIAVQLDRIKEYTFLYSPFSGAVHGGVSSFSIIYRKGGVEIVPIRHAGEFKNLARLTAWFALDSYRLLLNKYLPSAREDFKNAYLNEWQKPFRALFDEGSFPEIVTG